MHTRCAVHLVAGSTTSLVSPQIARTKTCTTPRKHLYEAIFLQKHVETCLRLHMRIFTISPQTIGSGSQRGFWCIQEVIEKCSHANVCMFQHVFAKKSPRTGAFEGSCKFLYERFGGKRGSWWIQQRGALRCDCTRRHAHSFGTHLS